MMQPPCAASHTHACTPALPCPALTGGRTSTRRVKDTDLQFDHGCQLFRATNPQMAAVVAEWARAGVAAEYSGRVGAYECASGAFAPREQLTERDLSQDQG